MSHFFLSFQIFVLLILWNQISPRNEETCIFVLLRSTILTIYLLNIIHINTIFHWTQYYQKSSLETSRNNLYNYRMLTGNPCRTLLSGAKFRLFRLKTGLLCLKMAYICFRLMTFNTRSSKQIIVKTNGPPRNPMENHKSAAWKLSIIKEKNNWIPEHQWFGDKEYQTRVLIHITD